MVTRFNGSGLPRRATLLAMMTLLFTHTSVFADSAAQAYDPPWAGELGWTNNNLFAAPLGANASYENGFLPWWETDVAHPIADYNAAKLPVGDARLDTALEADLTTHRLLPGWVSQPSPTGIDNVYTFTPGSSAQQNGSTRSGQYAFTDLGFHPIQALSADIAAEYIGNYDQRYWFPVNDEHRMFNDNTVARIVRGEIKYDTEDVKLRAFEGVPIYNWIGQNDLFGLLPAQIDTEYYRTQSPGDIAPRGGEGFIKTPFGSIDAIGGTEPRWRYGASYYVKYDAPTYGAWENSIVYRHESFPFGFEDPNETRWAVSANSSYAFSDRIQTHWGMIYQPFRLGRDFQNVDSNNNVTTATTNTSDALGGLARVEFHPTQILDMAGLGYEYLGPVAGDKQEVDVDASRAVAPAWTVSGTYSYRRPIDGPVPLLFEGTQANPGALVAEPRGPDDPFWVQWDNREAHILSLTLVFDPTPGTSFFKYQRNILDSYNLNLEEDAEWSGAIQYRATYYPTDTDRIYYYDEEGNLFYDPTFHTGALATAYPFSSATGVLQWHQDKWRLIGDLSGGQALAGNAIAYTAQTNFYKPSTTFMSTGLTVIYDYLKAYGRFGRDVWGPDPYQNQLGWTYHLIYQAGLSMTFLRDFESGVRYTGTRMTNLFIGSDMAAFNEFTFFLTYHFTLEHNFTEKLAAVGQPIPKTFPEAGLTVSEPVFTPDGSGPVRLVNIFPKASAEAGILSWQMSIKNSQGETVRKWDGDGALPVSFRWEGLDPDAKPLPVGTYRATLNVVDLYGNEITSPAQTIEIQSAPPAVAPAPKAYTVTNTPEGLRVTLSSLVLFDVNKSDLKDSAKEGLDQVVELLKAYPTNTLRISGHTDNTGSDTYNQTLSERRAQAVANYLVSKGSVAQSRISTVGYGKHRPVASNSTEEGRQQNRRVEIDILK